MLHVNHLIGFGASNDVELVISTIRSDTLNADVVGWTNFNIRFVFAVAGLTAPGGSLSQIRLTLEGGAAEGFAWDGMTIGHKAGAGDAYDMAAAPVALLVSGSASGSTGAGGTVVTDWANFAWNQSSDIVFAIHQANNAATDTTRGLDGASNVTAYQKAGASDVGTADVSGFALASVELQLVKKIEVR